MAVLGASRVLLAEFRAAQSSGTAASTPWYRRAYLWGQTNITERDPVQYDIAWWRKQWQRTQVQALIINAGGIVAYYPTLVNLTSEATWRAPLHELIKVGPFTVKLRLPEGMRQASARLLVSGATQRVAVQGGSAVIEIPSILDHEVLVVE